MPDLATEVPEPSADGLTYTFTIKDGVTFGPPVNREITSQDILYSFERIGTPSVAAQYAFYYNVIEGMEDFAAGKAKTISGITTPDDKTIIFKLTTPTGDFLYRVAMPATAPIPEEVAKCHPQAGEYGRYIVTSGPYMIDGADKLDISSCGSQKPISGFNPSTGLKLVRNPSYDPATDNTEFRQSNPGPLRDHGQHQPRQHLRPDRARGARDLLRDAPQRGPEALRPGPGDPRAAAGQRRRPHLVRLHEPHDAAVRRRPRAQGDEPRDGPRGHPARLGRAGVRQPPDPHAPELAAATSPTTSRTSRPPWRATSRPPRPRWPSRSTTPTRTAPATPRLARA